MYGNNCNRVTWWCDNCGDNPLMTRQILSRRWDPLSFAVSIVLPMKNGIIKNENLQLSEELSLNAKSPNGPEN